MSFLIEAIHPTNLIDIVVVASLIYLTLQILRGTLALQVLKGLALLCGLIFVGNFFQLRTLSWIAERMVPVFVLSVVILFHPEIRRGLARLGAHTFGTYVAQKEKVLDAVTTAAGSLSSKRIGGLIVLEREAELQPFVETGTALNAEVSSDILETIFDPHTPLHDGAVIIRHDTILAAGCILPLAHDEQLERRFGTRHRAAIGLSRDTDAIIVIVSEETGTISISAAGRIVKGLDGKTLREMLLLYTSKSSEKKGGGS